MNSESVVLKKLEDIDAILTAKYPETEDIGVLSGISGIALFKFYYSRFTQNERHADVGAAIISTVFERINNGYDLHTFCSGISGALWAIQLLEEEDFIAIDHDTLLPNFDDFLSGCITRYADGNFYDFLHGVLGIGYYFLKRYQNTTHKSLKDRYKQELSGIVFLLESTAQKEGDMNKWESFLVREEGLKGYNLGLAHGMSSIVNFLSRLMVYPDFYSNVKPLLQGAVNYILHCESDNPGSAMFPSWVTNKEEKNENSRLGWCYGDLGVGISVWRAGKALKSKPLCDKAIRVLKHSAHRRDPEEARIKDAGLCHGSYGVMHIYHQMYKLTGEPLFENTAKFWLEQALAMAVHKNGYAGYMQWRGGDHAGWEKKTNLLEGVSGIGLAMISYLASFSTKWDECLMLR